MSGTYHSLGGMLGTEDGPEVGGMAYDNGALTNYNNQAGANYAGLLQSISQGQDMRYVDPSEGTKLATNQVMSNPILSQLYGNGGQMTKNLDFQNQQMGNLTGLQNQGFKLQPQDHSMYGQMSGNIARQFGQQGNQAASNLASRGLSNSGAAGATFSGLQGSQNEMLRQAQQQIGQQRFQNTMQQIGQQQSFLNGLQQNNNQMGAQAGKEVDNQYGRQVTGSNAHQQAMQAGLNALGKGAESQNSFNQGNNASQLAAAGFQADNKPMNFMDYANAGAGSSLYNVGASPGKFASSFSGSMGSNMGSSAATAAMA